MLLLKNVTTLTQKMFRHWIAHHVFVALPAGLWCITDNKLLILLSFNEISSTFDELYVFTGDFSSVFYVERLWFTIHLYIVLCEMLSREIVLRFFKFDRTIVKLLDLLPSTISLSMTSFVLVIWPKYLRMFLFIIVLSLVLIFSSWSSDLFVRCAVHRIRNILH